MDNQLFRKKSIDRISSPEALHDYMRVTSPRLWMILSAIIVLLAGLIIYASTATMENTMPLKISVTSFSHETEGTASHKETQFYSSLPMSYKDSVMPGMTVRLGSEQGKVDLMSVMDDGTVQLVIRMDNDRYSPPDGEYDAELVLESTTPISFLWN